MGRTLDHAGQWELQEDRGGRHELKQHKSLRKVSNWDDWDDWDGLTLSRVTCV